MQVDMGSLLFFAVVFVLLFLVIDTIIRWLFSIKLRRSVYKKGDYRIRHQKIGNGKKTIDITLLGDSVMYGEGSDVQISFIESVVQDFIHNGYHVDLHNLAVTGHTVGDVATKQTPLLKKTDLIFVYVGGNNYFKFHSTRNYQHQLSKLEESLRNKRVVWFTIGDPRFLWLLPVLFRWIFYFRAKTFSTLLKEMVRKNASEDWYLIDLFTLAFAEMRRQKKTPRHILSEGVHLGHEGQKFLSDLILVEFKKLKIKM